MTFHTPARTGKIKAFWRRVDWPVVAAFAGLLLVLALIWNMWSQSQFQEQDLAQKEHLISELVERGDQINDLQAEVGRLTFRLGVINDRADRERRSAARERETLLRQQRQMLRILRSLGVEIAPNSGVIVVTPRGNQPAGGGGQRPRQPREPRSPGLVPPLAPEPPRSLLEDLLDAPQRLL